MPIWKRLFDLGLGLVLAVLVAPFMILVCLRMILTRDLPILYVSERMKGIGRPFQLVKIRTMRAPDSKDAGPTISAGDNANRITPLGAMLRGARLDEIPQIWNVLRGDMSFVGPRPPLRRYTELFPELYGPVLSTPPGITGLASILFHKIEARLLADARTPEESEAIYVARCVRPKARLDMLYCRNRSLGLDLYILYLTTAKLVPLPGRRARRIRG